MVRSVVTDAQTKTPTYDLAVTHKKEMTAIFKRLWKFMTSNRSGTSISIS